MPVGFPDGTSRFVLLDTGAEWTFLYRDTVERLNGKLLDDGSSTLHTRAGPVNCRHYRVEIVLKAEHGLGNDLVVSVEALSPIAAEPAKLQDTLGYRGGLDRITFSVEPVEKRWRFGASASAITSEELAGWPG